MDPDSQFGHWIRLNAKSTKDFLQGVHQDLISSPYICNPPFGKKKSTYVDWFASGKPLKTIEYIMQESVLPYYANTHTYSTSTARYTSTCVANSRRVIGRCLNAYTTEGHPHQAAILFCGDGSTAAISKVRNILRLGDYGYWIRKARSECGVFGHDQPTHLSGQFSNPSTSTSDVVSAPLPAGSCQTTYDRLPAEHRPVVFVSIQEHHSNLLPWRESCAEVVVIGENSQHQLDLDELESQLRMYRDRPLKIGSFSAGSNLTGVLNDTIAIAELLHKYNAFAFFDYAGVGAYTVIDMNPPPSDPSIPLSDSMAYKDGVFLSPHKMVGGPGCSGVLAARLEIFSWADRNSSTTMNEILPSCPAGGTVDFVSNDRHKYVKSVLLREEAGTPNILATIRTGLVVRLQEIMDPSAILAKECRLAASIYERLTRHGCIEILGTPTLDRVAVFSAMATIPMLSTPQRPLQIHYSLLSMMMNDFFGIEMRGGCMCAGPYGSKLLGFGPEKVAAFWKLLVGGEDSSSCAHSFVNKRGSWAQLDEHESQAEENIHQRDLTSPAFKPGFVRFSFPYFAREKDIEFVLESFEWVARYGFLLIPLYQLDSSTGVWSIRENLRKAICQDMNQKRLNSGRRNDYVAIATECIYNLHKLFNHPARPAHAADVPQGFQGPFVTRTEDSTAAFAAVGTRPASGIFNSASQAQRYLRRLSVLSSKASTWSSSPIFRPFVTTTSSPAHDSLPSESSCPANQSLELCSDSDFMIVQDQTHPILPPSPTLPSDRSQSVSRRASGASAYSRCESTTFAPITSISHRSTAKNTGSDEGNVLKRPSPLATFRRGLSAAEGKINTVVAAALNELSSDHLEEELREVDCSLLAKEMRWFAIPIEVAKVYTSQEQQGHGSFPSCFPKRRM